MTCHLCNIVRSLMLGYRQPDEVEKAKEALRQYEASVNEVNRVALDQVDMNYLLGRSHNDQIKSLAAGVLGKITKPNRQ